MSDVRLPVAAVVLLGITQIIGYGTLYYSFSILAPAIARDFGHSTEWIFGLLSCALLAGGLVAPWIGKAFDLFGAGKVMCFGSVVASLALMICSLSSGLGSFAICLLMLEVAANLVQYGAAFALLVQLQPAAATRSITYLTLIAGFASTLFWPLTSALGRWMSWQEVYQLYAALNLLVCLPAHLWLARRLRRTRSLQATSAASSNQVPGLLSPDKRRQGFLLMAFALSMQALLSSAVLVHMVPLLTALGLGGIAVLAGSLFGPSQVASRLINMLLGKDLTPLTLALLSALLMAVSPLVLLLGAPSVVHAIAFACLFGFGNGLFSITSGTLPLYLFGSAGYGALQGRVTSARLIASALAPFALAFLMENTGISVSLSLLGLCGLISILAFGMVGR
ncbi:arsenite efflux MFS transporter ArsK [Rhizobium sp. FKY42]|uniref:arsenite efflux MFS transporter ArsK n=1 Tax=Rhizobium sp. FKY42 TaxID=2562310 RepID=UPI001FEE225A|nr:arsenite efflux MFS transporter ArsK [Rhizobium sp. FKY42]